MSIIELKGVTKEYGQGHTLVQALKPTDFRLEAGQFVAIIGPSGSGKSTIAKLLASFWDVTYGQISYGGLDIRQLPLEYYSRQIAYVTQDNYLFDETIMENIRMRSSKLPVAVAVMTLS